MATSTGQQASTHLGIRAQVERLPASKIREIANTSLGMEGIIPLWFGEPDLPTPDFITAAGAQAMRQGCTFYTHNRGIPELRAALSEYLSRLHKTRVDSDRITVTASGCVAINLIQQVLTEPGTNMVVVTPLWPNLIESIHLMGGETRLVPLSFGANGWTLDLEQLFAQVDEHTIAILINSPNNPTGWMMQQDDQKAVLDFCRQRGLWLISDEVYNRLAYDQPVAPSLLDVADPDDKLIVVNSFSKTWAMSGWRLGWLTTPAALGPVLEKVIEFHYSCPAHLSQVAGSLLSLKVKTLFTMQSSGTVKPVTCALNAYRPCRVSRCIGQPERFMHFLRSMVCATAWQVVSRFCSRPASAWHLGLHLGNLGKVLFGCVLPTRLRS
jgi:aspartate/methionine/tyrosine aminotransferase